MGVLADTIGWARKSGNYEKYRRDLENHRNPLRFISDIVQGHQADSEAWAKGVNSPEQQQEPEAKASRQAAQEEVKRKGGGTVLSPQRLGVSGVDLGRHRLRAADANGGANKLGVGVR